MIDLDKALKELKGHADWIGLRWYSEKTKNLFVLNDKPQALYTKQDEGVMLEVLVNGNFGYAGTTDITGEGLLRALSKAKKMAQATMDQNLEIFTKEERPTSQGQYWSQRQRGLDTLTTATLFDCLRAATESMALNSSIVSRQAYAKVIETEIQMVNSSGARTHQNFNMVGNSLTATAQLGKESQSRSEHGGLNACFQVGAEFFQKDSFYSAGERVAHEALELLQAENTPTGITDVILAPDQMALQIHESIGHPLEYDRILGDERNYAGWSFVKPEDFGHLQYGSPLMNVTFDPSVPGEMASYLYDDGGALAEKKYLIKDGKLLQGLGGLESQKRLRLPGVANFRSASWNRAPIDRMANINLEEGEESLEQLISRIEKGVLMRSNRSWSIDDYRNKFQFGCEYAQKIEEGRLTQVLKNPNYRGTSLAFWNSLAGITKQTEIYGSPICGKGEPSQVIRVGHRSPYSLFKNIEIFGA